VGRVRPCAASRAAARRRRGRAPPARSGCRAAIFYAPVDHYGSPDEIVTHAPLLRHFARIIIHCHRLCPHFEPFAPVEYLDHPIKFAAPLRRRFRRTGNLLWVGVRSNLPPLVEWVNEHPLPLPLDVLTNPEDPDRLPSPEEFGFRSDRAVTVHRWTPERHIAFAAKARAAIDVKGSDFRSRHKPPAKAIDFLASGLPLAMNPDSSPAEHLAGLGFRVCSPLDTDRWLSEAYWNETRAIGRQLRHDLTGPKVAARFLKIVKAVLAERAGAEAGPMPVHLPDSLEDRPMPKKKPRKKRPAAKPKALHPLAAVAQDEYDAALRLALDGKHDEAWDRYERLAPAVADSRLAALIRNDLGALAALRGDLDAARTGFSDALGTHAACEPARANLVRLSAHIAEELAASDTVSSDGQARSGGGRPVRVAVLSFLFNWPSTGGGIVHTVELVQFLARAGYEVHHVYACFAPWEVGVVTEKPPFESTALPFTEAEWDVPTIQARFRAAVEEFRPDYVIITDSWNVKPLLAEAVSGYPYLLRLQALECLCPLNNVRLLPEPGGTARQCPLHQLASPDACARCVRDRGHFSGDLHRAERSLSGVGTPEYREKFLKAFAEAEAVLVVTRAAAGRAPGRSRLTSASKGRTSDMGDLTIQANGRREPAGGAAVRCSPGGAGGQ
jgi:hypothetical protein